MRWSRFILVAACLGGVLLPHVMADEPLQPLKVIVEADDRVIVTLADDPTFFSEHPYLSATVVYQSCTANLSPPEVMTKVWKEELCTDSVTQASLTQSGSYDFSPPHTSMIIVGSCRQAEGNCQEHPEEFEIIQTYEFSRSGDQSVDVVVSIAQVG